MITQGQKDVIADFFSHTVGHKSVKGIAITRDVPNLGKVVYLQGEEDDISLGTITIRELGLFHISNLLDSELLALVSFIQDLDALRCSVQKACELALPNNKTIIVYFDWETNKKSRFLFVNNCANCDYGQEYKALRLALTSLGYVVKQDPADSSVAYIIQYKADYLAKSRFGKFLYTISHIG